MRPGGGGKKGGAYERSVAKRLSLWVSGLKKKDLFWRSAMSGGRSTIADAAKRYGENTLVSGDLCSTSAVGIPFLRLFSVECRHYKDFNTASLVFGRTGLLWKLWDDALKHTPDGREPIIFARQNFMGEITGTSEKGWEILRPGFTHGIEEIVRFPVLGLRIMRTRDFFSDVKFRKIRDATRHRRKRL